MQELLTNREMPSAIINHVLHDTLVLVCHEGTKGTNQSYGNLFSQVDFLCKRHGIKPVEIMEIQRMRRHSNHNVVLSQRDLAYDVRALALLTSAVLSEDIPSSLRVLLPTEPQSIHRQPLPMTIEYLRCIVREWDDRDVKVVTDHDDAPEVLTIRYGVPHDGIDMCYLKTVFREGMQLNVLNAQEQDGVLLPRLLIVEPDFLVDISSIAGCFAEYGHHPLSFVMKQMGRRANTQATLLGNFADTALDDIINHEDTDLAAVLQENFRKKALEYAVCKGFNEDAFKEDALRQIANLKETVAELLKTYQRKDMILEPSFVCEKLGLQGRVDLMTVDFRLLVEQKSGRNMHIEYGRKNPQGSMQLENHYVQLLLYYGVLRYNFHVNRSKTDIRLLYSKYPPKQGLMVVSYYQQLFDEAIRFRNQLVATQYWIGKRGFETILPHFTERTLNVNQLDSPFYHQYLFPQITAITEPLHRLNPLEKTYLTRMLTFVYQEQLMSKVGAQEGVGSADAYLWNMPLAEKKDTGNIYTDLLIEKKERSKGSRSGYDMLTLRVPPQGDDFLPNFRQGDMVYLYAYRKGEEPDVRQSILYKGVLAEIRSDRIVIHLADGQQNPDILQVSRQCQEDNTHRATTLVYAIEHSGASSVASQVGALHHLMTAPQRRRDLLLGQQTPQCDETIELTSNYHPTYDDMVLQARRAKDYYLLVGPPGTGKTSMALRFLVQEHLAADNGSILLMAYTNRAVDEICAMLVDAGIDFLRIANEFSTDERFRSYLMDSLAKENAKLHIIRQRLVDVRIVVGTTSMLMSRSYLFQLKTFSLAIVDEASQILEPNLVGLLCEVEKFILIGDHKQLPAVVQQSEEESAVHDRLLQDIQLYNCRQSLFERLIRIEQTAEREQFVGVLRKQGRMHPDVALFPSSHFYADEQIEAVPLEHQMEEVLPYSLPSLDEKDDFLKSGRVLFIPSHAQGHLISDKVNTDEARIVADVLWRVYRFYGEKFDATKTVGVIVPYRNQIAMIRKEIERLGVSSLEKISIDTIERYQGSQREVIIYSFTIRYHYQLDFLTNNSFTDLQGRIIDRKLNVALTRARQQLIMTGHVATLSGNELFAELLDDITRRGGMWGYEWA